MGEIDEALRRARQERSPDGDVARPAPRRTEASEDVYSASAARHRKEASSADEAAEAAREEASSAESSPRQQEPAAAREPSPPATPRPLQPAAEPGPVANGVALTHLGDEARAPQGVIVDDGGAVTDACLQMALRVRKALADRDARTLVVVSAFRNEGKTTVSCNLALALASLGQIHKVALVDLDLRRPSLETVLELSTPVVGIDDVLAGREPLAAARLRVASPLIDVYPCLRGQPKAHELLLGPHFDSVIAQLREAYDVVIFDSPPSLLVPDATIILQHVECFAPVARAGVTRARSFKKMLDMLPRKRMLGGILDCGSMPRRKGYYDHYAPDEIEPAPEAAHGV